MIGGWVEDDNWFVLKQVGWDDFDFDFKKSNCSWSVGLVCEQVYRADWDNSLVKKTIGNNQGDNVDFKHEKNR